MIVNMFTTGCYVSNNLELAEKLKSACLNILDTIITENYNENFGKVSPGSRNGKTTFFKYHKLPDDVFGELHDFILKQSIIYLKKLGTTPSKNMKVEKSWLSVMHKNDNHPLHTHIGANILSGTFYIDVNDNHAPLVFLRPEWAHDTIKMLKIDNYNEYTSQSYILPVKKGQLVLFKSDLAHEVPTNNENDRLVISFNVTNWKEDK